MRLRTTRELLSKSENRFPSLLTTTDRVTLVESTKQLSITASPIVVALCGKGKVLYI